VPATDRQALIVTKELELAVQSAMILQKQHYRCEVFKAGLGARRGAERALRQAVPPRDCTATHVAVLRIRGSARRQRCERPGTAGGGVSRLRRVGPQYVHPRRRSRIHPARTGTKDLRDAIADALLQVQQHDQYQSSKKRKALEHIDRFVREDKFQLFIEEMFHELRYLGVRRTHGPTEKGKDIVCYEVNRMGRAEYVGIQIKLGDVHASGGRGSLTDLWRQSLEAFNSRVAFPEGEQYLDKFVVIASGRINELARDKLMDFLRSSHAHRRIFFLDREELADLLVSSCPAVLASIE
jgi:hypothetical protein